MTPPAQAPTSPDLPPQDNSSGPTQQNQSGVPQQAPAEPGNTASGNDNPAGTDSPAQPSSLDLPSQDPSAPQHIITVHRIGYRFIE